MRASERHLPACPFRPTSAPRSLSAHLSRMSIWAAMSPTAWPLTVLRAAGRRGAAPRRRPRVGALGPIAGFALLDDMFTSAVALLKAVKTSAAAFDAWDSTMGAWLLDVAVSCKLTAAFLSDEFAVAMPRGIELVAAFPGAVIKPTDPCSAQSIARAVGSSWPNIVAIRPLQLIAAVARGAAGRGVGQMRKCLIINRYV